VEVFGVFGGDLPARIGAVKPEDKTRGRPRGQYSGTIAAGKAEASGKPASGKPDGLHA